MSSPLISVPVKTKSGVVSLTLAVSAGVFKATVGGVLAMEGEIEALGLKDGDAEDEGLKLGLFDGETEEELISASFTAITAKAASSLDWVNPYCTEAPVWMAVTRLIIEVKFPKSTDCSCVWAALPL